MIKSKCSIVSAFDNSRLSWLAGLITERFGCKINLSIQNELIVMTLPGQDGFLTFLDVQENYSKTRFQPNLIYYDPRNDGLSGILESAIPTPTYKDFPSKLFTASIGKGYIYFDLLGMFFWVLARIEEVDIEDFDEHQRVSPKNLHSCQYNYYDRPIIDEWFNILKQIMQLVWPNFVPINLNFKVSVSHDIDRPSISYYNNISEVLRASISKIFRGQIIEGLLCVYIKFFTRDKLLNNDPYNTFSWLMSESEKLGLISEFFFIAGGDNYLYDGKYDIKSNKIIEIIRQIINRGHSVGLHPSYDTYQSPSKLALEASKIQILLKEFGITQYKINSRMHYLRFEWPTTLNYLNNINIGYDSTLGFYDRPGFRCGTARPYQGFNPISGSILNIRIRPLIFMDSSINLNDIDLLNKVYLVRERCKTVNGVFELLWHNSSLTNEKSKEIYRSLLHDGNL